MRTYICSPVVIALVSTFIDGFHTNDGYDNISIKFDFQGPELKVKVTVAILRKTLSSL